MVTRWHPRFRVEEIPNVECSEIPIPQDEKNPTANDVFTKAQHIISTANPRMKRIMQDLVKKKVEEDDALGKMKKIKDPKNHKVSPSSEDSNLDRVSPVPPIKEAVVQKSQSKSLRGISISLLEKV